MNTLSAIFADAAPILGGPLVISVLSLIILVGWEKLASRGAHFSLSCLARVVVVALGIVLNQVFRLVAPTLYINEPQTPLVQISRCHNRSWT